MVLPRILRTRFPRYLPLWWLVSQIRVYGLESLQGLPHVPTLRVESQALVDMARTGVHFRNLELDLSMAPPAGPVDRPFDEELPDPFASVGGDDPDVVDEPQRLRREKSAGSDDHVAGEHAGRVLGEPLLRPASPPIPFAPPSKA